MRWIFTFMGLVFTALAVLGIILPVVPTTPLLLLAGYCFAKGSIRLAAWFSETVLYKRYIAEYMVTKALTVKQKCSILCMANAIMLASFLLVGHWALKGILMLCIVAANYVLIKRVGTLRSTKPAQQQKRSACLGSKKVGL